MKNNYFLAVTGPDKTQIEYWFEKIMGNNWLLYCINFCFDFNRDANLNNRGVESKKCSVFKHLSTYCV